MVAPVLPVLFVDDEPDNLELFKVQFEEKFSVRVASSAAEALKVLAKEDVGVLLTDERMPGTSGIELVAQVLERWPYTMRVIISAYSDPARLLRAINQGQVNEYIVKPWDKKALSACIERNLELAAQRRELAARAEQAEVLARDTAKHYDTRHIIGSDGGLRSTLEKARRAAQTDATVLVTGETGTGKELVARLIHDASARAEGPFVAVNCSALDEGVLESELFGHEPGAFTGAQRLRRGRFEIANGGTLFLDEIGDISPKMQVSLLRVLQEKTFERVGGSHTLSVDVRVVAATHRDLLTLVRQGRLREDLYYRLNVIPIPIPPLRDRAIDIPALVAHFVSRHGRPPGSVMKISETALQRLRCYSWPGNVRELENMVQRALALSDGAELTAEDFSFTIDIAPSDIREYVRQAEEEETRQAFLANGGNCTRSAASLGIPRTTFVSRAKKYGLIP